MDNKVIIEVSRKNEGVSLHFKNEGNLEEWRSLNSKDKDADDDGGKGFNAYITSSMIEYVFYADRPVKDFPYMYQAYNELKHINELLDTEVKYLDGLTLDEIKEKHDEAVELANQEQMQLDTERLLYKLMDEYKRKRK